MVDQLLERGAASARHGSRALDDETLSRFVRDGFITVQTSLPRSFHADVCQRAGAILDREGNWGNNILPRLPQLRQVLDDPAVAGALASLLGPTYVLHPHRYCHRNEPGSTAQRLHKDTRDFSGDHHLRHHRPRWVIAFYYPQDVSSDMGPTAIVPRSQYYLEQPPAAQWPEALLCPPTGTVALVHFGMWHRATANLGARPRYMFKFEFGRMDEPDAVSEGVSDELSLAFDLNGGPAPHHAAWSHIARWLRHSTGSAIGDSSFDVATDGLRASDVATRRAASDALAGQPGTARHAIPALVQALHDQDEPVRLNAAYALGAVGAAAADECGQVLRSSTGLARRYAACALTAMGLPAVDTLSRLVVDAEDEVRIAAIDALGDMGTPARPAVQVLGQSLGADNPWVRRHAAEALGLLGAGAAPTVERLGDALADEQPYVRMNAATALARIGRAAAEAVPGLIGALADADRYTRAWAGIALRRVGTAEATSALLDHLETTRWCATTTANDRY